MIVKNNTPKLLKYQSEFGTTIHLNLDYVYALTHNPKTDNEYYARMVAAADDSGHVYKITKNVYDQIIEALGIV